MGNSNGKNGRRTGMEGSLTENPNPRRRESMLLLLCLWIEI
uniref:Uncharacterized protein n=1 Tax=Anguilla anguilla TaxID=7936 RepID=A0A0E9TZS7_ANGAN